MSSDRTSSVTVPVVSFIYIYMYMHNYQQQKHSIYSLLAGEFYNASCRSSITNI